VKVAKEGYDVAAPVIKQGVDAVAPVVSEAYKVTAETAAPLLQRAAPVVQVRPRSSRQPSTRIELFVA
jgi:hypothetical protein